MAILTNVEVVHIVRTAQMLDIRLRTIRFTGLELRCDGTCEVKQDSI